MKWGIRRYQNPDGTLTAEGRRKYGDIYGLARANASKKRRKGVAVGAAVGVAGTALRMHRLRSLTTPQERIVRGVRNGIIGGVAGGAIGRRRGYRKIVGKEEVAAQKSYRRRKGTGDSMLKRQTELEDKSGFRRSSVKDNRKIGEQLLKEYGEDNFRRFVNDGTSSRGEKYLEGTLNDVLKKYGEDSAHNRKKR